MKTKNFVYTLIICFWHTILFGQVRMVINGAYYNDNETAYIGCVSSFGVTVEGIVNGAWRQLYLDNYGDNAFPSGWSYSFQPTNNYNKTSVSLTSGLPSSGGVLRLAWTLVSAGTISVNIQTIPQLNFTSTPAIYGSYQSAGYSVYAATSGNVNWTGYGGVRINGSGNYCCGQSATVSTQQYGGLLEVTASNGCGTSPAIASVVGTPFIQNTTVNGSNGSSATVSWVATLSLDTRGTATGANWNVTNGSGSISPNGTSCNAYPSNFLRVVGTATNQYGSGQDWTFYIWKDGYSGYRMAYPNPAKDQLTLEFDDAIIASGIVEIVGFAG